MSLIQLSHGEAKPVEWQDLTPLNAANFSVADEQVLAFIDALSRSFRSSPELRTHSELVALGFWLRSANIQALLKRQKDVLLKPLGLVVHYTPANVDTMFVYSWICALLMGNRNIVRIASQASDLQRKLLDGIERVINQPEHYYIRQANCFIQYDRTSAVGTMISQQADGRVLWGGDESVNAIRALPSKPRCRDISFADRYSAVVVQGDQLNAGTTKIVAERLVKDIQPYAQQACSSPRMLFWLGSTRYQQDVLIAAGQRFSSPAPEYQRNEQLVCAQYLSALGKVSQVDHYHQLTVLTMNDTATNVTDAHPGQAILFCYTVAKLQQIAPCITSKLQTLSYWGLEKEELIKFLAEPSITGVDRVVPLGQSLAFSPQWDGYDLLTELSRLVVVE